MPEPNEVVTLRNGAEEVMSVVAATMLNLELLMERRPIALIDLILLARDPSYEPFGNNGEYLQSVSLVGADGRMHDSIRNIVLSAAEGEDLFSIVIRSPLAPR